MESTTFSLLTEFSSARDFSAPVQSHPYQEGYAVRTIVWFAPDGQVVVALFANNKAQMGDVFYASVGSRADQAIDRWLHDTRDERKDSDE